jgi:rhodanese-related sulfurtransferase
MSKATAGSYAGDVTADHAWDVLSDDPRALLVDVRTMAEWTYVGVPDLTSLGKDVVLVEWQQFPEMAVVADFCATLEQAFGNNTVPRDAPLYFLCRSGVRSKAAAIAMTAAGYSNCFNVTGGFEGPPDQHRHRGALDGWKARQHPWRQG